MQKDFWLKVLDHQYYDDLNLELGLAKNAVQCKNKIRGLESLEKVESILQNLMADEKCNWNYIFQIKKAYRIRNVFYMPFCIEIYLFQNFKLLFQVIVQLF